MCYKSWGKLDEGDQLQETSIFFFFQDWEHVHTRARFMLMYGKQQLELDMEQQTGFI